MRTQFCLVRAKLDGAGHSSRSENKKVVEAVGVTSSEGFSSSTPVGLIELCAGAGGIDVDFDTATKRRLTEPFIAGRVIDRSIYAR